MASGMKNCHLCQTPACFDRHLGFENWRIAPRNKFQDIAAVIASSAQSPTQKLVALKIYGLSVPCLIGFPTCLDEATLEVEHKPLQKLTAGLHTATPSDLLRAGDTFGLGVLFLTASRLQALLVGTVLPELPGCFKTVARWSKKPA